MSRKEIFLLHSVSMVNEMSVSIEFNVSWKAKTPSFPMMQKLSSTYHFQILGERDELLIADSSISSMQRLATTGLTELPIAQPWTCLYKLFVVLYWGNWQITILARYLGNTTFFLTNIHNHLHFYNFTIHAFYWVAKPSRTLRCISWVFYFFLCR